MENPSVPAGNSLAAWGEYLAEALKIIGVAQERGLCLRLAGGLAVAYQCPEHLVLLDRPGRVLTDLDFVVGARDLSATEVMFQELGYRILAGRGVTMESWTDRRVFERATGPVRKADLFVDSLNFCHPIDLRERLHLEPVTIPLTDVLLGKLQIIEMTEKDLRDIVVLFLEHEVGGKGFDHQYVSELLRKDWGFHHTVDLNLARAQRYALSISDLNRQQLDRLDSRIHVLREGIDSAPKTIKWKLRARIGTARQWYRDVDEGLREVPHAFEAPSQLDDVGHDLGGRA